MTAEQRVAQLEAILDRITEICDQPFTETYEDLPAWIETILKTRPAYAFKDGVKAAREIDVMRSEGNRRRGE